ncbi:hypothetical protein D1872_290750 [compost metagenome]
MHPPLAQRRASDGPRHRHAERLVREQRADPHIFERRQVAEIRRDCRAEQQVAQIDEKDRKYDRCRRPVGGQHARRDELRGTGIQNKAN